MSTTTFDYVVVGAGTAGCLLANRLSADPKNRVLLLEAGKKDNYPWIHIPVGYLYCIGNPRTDWLFNTEAEAGLNGRSLRYPRGKTLGGCSSINGMIYMRGQARDYDNWADLTGDDDWSWENTLPAFKAHENHYKLDDDADPADGDNGRFSDLHGHGGEWRIEKQRLRWDILDSFAEAAEQSGVRRTHGNRLKRVGFTRAQASDSLISEYSLGDSHALAQTSRPFFSPERPAAELEDCLSAARDPSGRACGCHGRRG